MNKTIFFVCSVLLFSSHFCFAQGDSTVKARQILKIEQMLADALPVDSTLWSKYLDPSWHIVDEDGNSSSKKEFLASFKPFPKTVKIHADVIKPIFSFHGDVAVVQYVADENENAYGQPLHTTYATMDVWYKTDTSWMMLSMQNFEVPALPPSIYVSQQILQQYAGTYRLDNDNVAELTVKNDSLFIQKNKKTVIALWPETVNIFFRKGDARGRKFFVKDANGKMIMRERRNGQDLVWKRIN